MNIGEEATDAYDLAIGDAFGGLSVPWHLATVEMIEEVRRVLRVGGLYVLNVIDGGDAGLVRAEAATLVEVFDHVAVIKPPHGPDGNYVLIASDERFALPAISPSLGSVVSGEEAQDFVGGARPLTDDFAPADQLLDR